MRALTAGESTLLSSATKQLSYVVRVTDETGTYQFYGQPGGDDWVVSMRGAVSLDEPIPSLTVELRRDHAGTSLAPFRGDSPMNAGGPAIDVGRSIIVDVAYTAWGVIPSYPADYRRMAIGTIDNIDFAATNVVIQARSEIGAQLVDAWVQDETEYGTAGGRRLDLVMQDIINDWAPGVTLQVPVVPAYNVTSYMQQPESVWDALRTLAGLIGWDVRIMFSVDGFTELLVLIQPDRTKTVPDWTFAPAMIHSVDQLSIDRTWIRNSIRVTYVDAAGDVQHEDVSDATSIARYGEQWAEIVRGAGSPIDTSSEALALANAALSDLKDPVAEQTVQVPLFWPLELGDLYRFSANGIHYNSNQDLAVTGHRWEISAKKARSWISVRGKPAGFYKDWLNPGTIDDIGEEDPTAAPEVVGFPTVELIVGGGLIPSFSIIAARLRWMSARGGQWDVWLKKGGWPTTDGTNTQDSTPDDSYKFGAAIDSAVRFFPPNSYAAPGDGTYYAIFRGRSRFTLATGPLYFGTTVVTGGASVSYTPADATALLALYPEVVTPGTHRIKWQTTLTTAGGWTLDITGSLNGGEEFIVAQGVAVDVAGNQYDYVYPRGTPGPAGFHDATVVYTLYVRQAGVLQFKTNAEVRDALVAAGDLIVS